MAYNLLGGLGDRPITTSAGLHVFAVDTRGTLRSEATFTGLFLAVVIHVLNVEGVKMAGKNTIEALVSHPLGDVPSSWPRWPRYSPETGQTDIDQ